MSGRILWGKWLAWTTIIMASGYGLLIATTPSEEQLYAQLSPELKKKVDDIRAQRLLREAGGKTPAQLAIDAAGESEKVVWGEQLAKVAASKGDK